jgi:tRNA/rRNA methyltransferase
MVRDGSHDVDARIAGVRFVLVEPSHPGNVGAAARALKNLGFSRLELADPRCDPDSPEAVRMAVDAADVLAAARVHDGLDAALAGASTVVGTSRRTGKQRHPHWRLDALAPELGRLAGAGELAFVFGREAHGLSDEELDRCTHLVHFASGDAYPSFNLAQSVLIAAYEMRLALVGEAQEDAVGPVAGHDLREPMFRHLEAALRSVGFLTEETSESMMRKLRRLLGRAEMTPDDVRIVRGIARQVLWAATRAGLPVPEDEGGKPQP